MAATSTAGAYLPPQSSLRGRQIDALKRMLNLNQPLPKTAVAAEPVWKVLVYDKYGSDIISPLLTVKELRSLGVTLHLLLDSPREQIQDAVAIYFVRPTTENIDRIGQDFKEQLYSSFYFNFISPIARTHLEDLARAAVTANCVEQIAKVYDQYLNFVSLEEDFFITRQQNTSELSYYAINRTGASDCDILAVCNFLVESLFSVFVTAGTIPIIRCPRGNAAEIVAEALDKKIRDNFRDPRNGMFSGDNIGQLSFSRPLLVILDRDIDLATPLHHTWTYQALVHDCFDYTLNRVTLPKSSPAEGGASVESEKVYDLLAVDKFWQTHRGSPFPNVAEAVQGELNEYKASEEEVMRLKSVMGASEETDPDIISGALSDNTAKLTSAISSLPELLDKKKRIDVHTNIATALLDEIKERKLDMFFEAEEKMITRSSMDKSVLDIISDPSAGTPADKLRLFLIYYTLSPEGTDADLSQFTAALESVGADMTPVNYIKRRRAYTKIAANPRAQQLGSYSASTSAMSSMFSQLVIAGHKYVTEGMKNFVVGPKNLPVTRVVEQLMDLKTTKDTEDYKYYDPKMLRVPESSSIPRSQTPFKEAYVFMVGGGNYIEYQNLQDYCKRHQGAKKITYGTSELMNAQQFLRQLSELGQAEQ